MERRSEEEERDGEGGASAPYEEEEGKYLNPKIAAEAIAIAARSQAEASPSSSSYSHNKRSGGAGGGLFNCSHSDSRNARRKLKEDLNRVRSLIARLEARQRVVSLEEVARVCVKGLGQGSGSGGEVANSAHPSSNSGQETGTVAGMVTRDAIGCPGPRHVMAGDAFAKERSTVGVRMALASNGSAHSHRRGKKREQEVGGGNLDSGVNKRPKPADLNRRGEPTGIDLHEVTTNNSRRGNSGPNVDVWGKCMHILEDLLKSRNAWAFEKPVLVIWPHLFDYSNRIKNPVDLGTVKSKLQSGEYSDLQEFANDVRLTFTNALAYNEEGSVFYNSAQQMKLRFDSKFRSLDMKIAREVDQNLAAHKGNISSQVEAVTARPPGSGILIQTGKTATQSKVVPAAITPEEKPVPSHTKPEEVNPPKTKHKSKSKAQRPDKPPNSRLGRSTSALSYGGVRPLTAKERERLPILIESLPADRVKKVIEILKQRNPACVESATGEVELDLGKFDEVTMFELHRLAMNWQKSKKKVLSRMLPSEGVEEAGLNNVDTLVSGKDPLSSTLDGQAQPNCHAKLQQNKKNEGNGAVRVTSSLEKERVGGSTKQEASASGSDSSSSSGSSSENSSSSGSGSDLESDADSDQSSQKA